VHLGWLDRSQAVFRAFDWLKTAAGIVGLVTAAYMIGSFILQGPGVHWQVYSDQMLAEAVEKQKPVILDFSAAWCAPCRELDEVTFHDREVVKQARQDFFMIKVDLTHKDNPGSDRLLQKYDVKGVPTVLFLDKRGMERRELRLVDFLPAAQFLVRMVEIRNTQTSKDK